MDAQTPPETPAQTPTQYPPQAAIPTSSPWPSSMMAPSEERSPTRFELRRPNLTIDSNNAYAKDQLPCLTGQVPSEARYPGYRQNVPIMPESPLCCWFYRDIMFRIIRYCASIMGDGLSDNDRADIEWGRQHGFPSEYPTEDDEPTSGRMSCEQQPSMFSQPTNFQSQGLTEMDVSAGEMFTIGSDSDTSLPGECLETYNVIEDGQFVSVKWKGWKGPLGCERCNGCPTCEEWKVDGRARLIDEFTINEIVPLKKASNPFLNYIGIEKAYEVPGEIMAVWMFHSVDGRRSFEHCFRLRRPTSALEDAVQWQWLYFKIRMAKLHSVNPNEYNTKAVDLMTPVDLIEYNTLEAFANHYYSIIVPRMPKLFLGTADFDTLDSLLQQRK
ncbi:MAG: hypothetical protein M1814_003355 [Vezdaea aestivalis]|nr:MAG: hypothetical protein M1814_003355 [Vezdaea aestivalis]